MKYGKTFILLVLAIFLFSLTGAFASEIDTPVASEDTGQLELSVNEEGIEDNLQKSEENTKLAVDENNETLSYEIDAEILTADQFNYTNLKEQIGSGGNINLNKGTYTYNDGDGDTIQISTSGVINGNGAVIDMAQSGHRAFYVTVTDVTIKNLTIKNANYGSGGAIYFINSGTVTNCNFTNNSASGDGGAIHMVSGTVTNCNFTNNKATGEDSWGGAIYMFSGSVENCNFTNNTATGSNSNGGAIYFSSSGTVTNCNFTNNSASGDSGAIHMVSGTVTNCNFTNNKATGEDSWGGAIYMFSGSVENCNFTNNTATGSNSNGGAIWMSYGSVENCNFTGNNATTGSAIYFYSTSASKTVSNSRLLNNRANAEVLEVIKNDNNITITFTGNDNLLNAIYSRNDAEVTFTNVTYWGANGITNTGSSETKPSRSNKETGQNITIMGVVNGNIINATYITDAEGMIILENVGDYYIVVRHDADAYYTEAEKTISNMTFSVNVTSQTTHNKTVNITAKSNIFSEFMEGKLLFILPNGTEINATYASNGTWWAVHTFDDYAVYQVNASYVGLDNVTVNNATITIDKINSTITLDDVVMNYGDSINVNVTTTGAVGITAKIDDKDLRVDNFTIPISDFNAGNYTLTVTTIPDEDHNSINKTVTIEVNKIDSVISCKDQYTQTYDGSVHYIEGTATGVTDIQVSGNCVYGFDYSNGAFSIRIFGDADTYKVTVTAIPDDNHNGVDKIISVKILPQKSYIDMNDVELDYGDCVNVTVTTTGAVGITAEIDGVNVTVDGYTIPISGLDAGTHDLTVTTTVDKNHISEDKKVKITVNKVNSTLTVEDIILDYGESKNITVTAEGATGITAKIDNVNVTVNGYTIPISGLGAGNYTLTVTSIPDDNHKQVTETAKITVNKARTEITVDSAAVDMKVLDEVPSGAALTPADAGNLTYKSSNETVVIVKDGKIKALGEGTATITVSFNGNDNYSAAESKNITVTVSLKDASVSVNNSTLNLFVDDTFTIVANTTPTGLNVTYIPDNSGVVTVENGIVTALKGGTATIIVKVGGDGVYVENSTTVAVSVSKIPAEIVVQNATVDMKVTDEVTPVVSLMPSDAGELDFTSSDVSVVTVDGIGTITAVGEGVANVTVRFIGNDKYAAAESKNITVTVSLKDVSVSVNNSTLDLKVDDTFTIVPTTAPAGLNVTYVPDDSGVYSIDDKGVVTALKEGTATIIVKVGGDGIYAENTTSITVTVNKQDANASVSIPENVTVGEDSNIEITLPSDATGNITLKVDGEIVDTVPVADGSANLTLPSLSAGNHTVEIAYSGDEKYNPVSATKDITVSKKETTPEIAVEGSNVDVKLPGDAAGNVTVKVDDTVVSTVPVTDGTASVKLPKLSAGNHTVEIAYSGDDKYKSSSKTATISVDKDSTKLAADNVTATYKVKKYLTITLTDSNGSPIANATVSVELKSAKNYTSDENGQIKVKVSNLVPKTYTAKITFKGDDNYIGSNITAKVTVKKATSKITVKAKTFKTTTKTKKYTVMLKANGKALKNKWVYLKVNGKKYKAKTNSKGKATFKITQLNKAGKFKATVTFKGNDYYKKATKKATIKVKSVWKTVQKGSKNSAIVKKIQRALKNHGYYLEYNGRYLKVDGIFWDYTEMAVKEFQYDKTLKVTGKVDEKTARKLGII